MNVPSQEASIANGTTPGRPTVAADQACLPLLLLEDEAPDPVAVVRSRRRARARARPARSACDSCRTRACRRPAGAGTRAAPRRRCAWRVRTGSRSSRRCTRRRAVTAPSGRSTARRRTAGASIVIARVATPSAFSSSSSPGSRASASAAVCSPVQDAAAGQLLVEQRFSADRAEGITRRAGPSSRRAREGGRRGDDPRLIASWPAGAARDDAGPQPGARPPAGGGSLRRRGRCVRSARR